MSTLFSYFKPTQEKKEKTEDAPKNVASSSKRKYNVKTELSRSALSPLTTANQTPSRPKREESPGEDSEEEIGVTGKVRNRMGVVLMQRGCGHQTIIRRTRQVHSSGSRP